MMADREHRQAEKLSIHPRGMPMPSDRMTSGGWCQRCQKEHSLPLDPARAYAFQLMDQLDCYGRIDFVLPKARPINLQCSTEYLFRPSGGKMFGVLSCRDGDGNEVILRAFSGQYNGLWSVEGWVDPLFDQDAFKNLTRVTEQKIKYMSRELTNSSILPEERQVLIHQRRNLSRKLMYTLHKLYHLVNFRGESLPLLEVFDKSMLPPSGTGDCCGPKLLNHAFHHGLYPESMAEFYWGKSNSSGTKKHGYFYPACGIRCQPILGFMLCGL